MEDESLVEKARSFAKKKHGNVRRKYGNELYISHPAAVAEKMAELVDDDRIIAAALLHDVIEDTPTSRAEIKELFGEKITALVDELTSDEKSIKNIGKKEYLTRKMNAMSSEAFLIKLADRENNVSDLHQAPRDFQTRYAAETRYILNNLRRDLSENERILIESIEKSIDPFT